MFSLFASENNVGLTLLLQRGNRGFPGGSEGKVSACNAGDLGLIPGLGRSPGEGNGNPLQYSCLETATEEPGRLQSMGSQSHRAETWKETESSPYDFI